MSIKQAIELHYHQDDLQELVCAIAQSKMMQPKIIFLSGPLGAGKTTFAQGWLRQMGVSTAITSPTYTIVQSYTCGQIHWHHFDCYRIQSVLELEDIGMDAYLSDHIICEWPEKAMSSLVRPDLSIKISYCEHVQRRSMIIVTQSKKYLEELGSTLARWVKTK